MNAPERFAWLTAIIERLCFGSVPVDGMYWFERTSAPKPQPSEPERALDISNASEQSGRVISFPNRKHAA